MSGPALVEAVDARAREVCGALAGIGDDELRAPSSLPGWSRLTIACHLRYSATTLLRMTADALAGEPTSYYPDGRTQQRPSTLEPDPSETPSAVVASLDRAATALCATWQELPDAAWETPVLEPPDNVDLGPTTLTALAMAALTELEVHGSDLDLGLRDWSRTFVGLVLPARVTRLEHRRTNHRTFDTSIDRTWLLRASEGPTFVVRAGTKEEPDATIDASARDLLALLLGRPFVGPVGVSGGSDVDELQRAFPGP